MRLMRRYEMARGVFHELNTAPMAARSWARGSSGMDRPAAASTPL